MPPEPKPKDQLWRWHLKPTTNAPPESTQKGIHSER